MFAVIKDFNVHYRFPAVFGSRLGNRCGKIGKMLIMDTDKLCEYGMQALSSYVRGAAIEVQQRTKQESPDFEGR